MAASIPADFEALRDAYAVWRAVREDDAEGLEVLRANAADPWMTTVILAQILDSHLAAHGRGLSVPDEWFRRIP